MFVTELVNTTKQSILTNSLITNETNQTKIIHIMRKNPM